MLPRDLTETYERIMQSIPQEFKEKAIRLLQFLVYSKEPLTLEQAVDVVATDFDEEPPRFSVDCRLFQDTDILRHCPSLVSVIYVESYFLPRLELHLAHFSVKEYLLLQISFEYGRACIAITRTFLAYMRDIGGDPQDFHSKFPLTRHAPQAWLTFARGAESSAKVSSEIVDFLREKEFYNRLNFIMGRYPDDWDRYQDLPRGPGLHYASKSGLTTVASLMIQNGADVNASGYYGSALNAAAHNGHLDIARLLVDEGADVNSLAGYGVDGSALKAASEQGHLDIVQFLLGKHANVNYEFNGVFETPLSAASRRGHIDIVRLLLEHNAEVNSTEFTYGSALNAASRAGHLNIIKMLLNEGAVINLQVPSNSFSALHSACKNGHVEVAEFLLGRGARFNANGTSYADALKTASAGGCAEVVQLLLEKREDVTLRGYDAGTSLQAACDDGN